MDIDLSAPLTGGALLQSITPLIAAIAFLFALRQQWRTLEEQRAHDREVIDFRMKAIEGGLNSTAEELRLMREAMVSIATQNTRLDFLEKAQDEMKRGAGFIVKPPVIQPG